jgi:hypothetical protein
VKLVKHSEEQLVGVPKERTGRHCSFCSDSERT